jgi:hypothetical protein
MVFSVRPDPRCYKQDKLGVRVNEDLVRELENSWGSVIVSCCCGKLVAEARGQFGNPEEGESLPIEAATKQRQWRRNCGH